MRSASTDSMAVKRVEQVKRLEEHLAAEHIRLTPAFDRLNKIKNLIQYVDPFTVNIKQLVDQIKQIEMSLQTMRGFSDQVTIKAGSVDYYSGAPETMSIPIETISMIH